MTARSSAPIAQSLPPTVVEPGGPLVAGLAANAELTAQLCKVHFPSQPSLNELLLLVLRTLISPGHHTPPDGIVPIFSQCVTHVPGLCVTNVPGLYPSQSSPQGEEAGGSAQLW